jgi:hypothetical protein
LIRRPRTKTGLVVRAHAAIHDREDDKGDHRDVTPKEMGGRQCARSGYE